MPNEFLSDNEFDFSAVDEVTKSLPEVDQDPSGFDFSGVDNLLSKNHKTKKLSAPKNPQPIASATSGGKVKSGYGVRVPPKKGASSFHQGIDIEASAGTPINPADEGEVIFVGNKKGKGLSIVIEHLDGRKTEYNHLSKTMVELGDKVKKEAVIGNVGQTGIATGPHLDFRVQDNKGNYVNPFDELATDPRTEGMNLELASKFNSNDFDFATVDDVAKQTKEYKEETTIPAIDPDKIDFKVGTKQVPAMLHWLTSNNKPKIIGANPLEVGDVVKTNLNWYQKYKSGRMARPDINSITDTWLRAWNPEYEGLNKKFRLETGGLNLAIVDDPKNLNYLGKGNYEIQARTSRGVKALFESYKRDGLAGYNATNKLINEQIDNLFVKNKEIKENFDKQVESKPYLNAMKSGIEHEAGAITHLATNVSYLGKALLTGNIKGYDSQEYLDLINEERSYQQTIGELEESIYRPPSFGGKVIAGTVGGIVGLPRFVLAGKLGLAGLPVMTYLENLHRGNRASALNALPMAIMSGSMHGAGEFLGASSGTSAPFRKITQSDLSLFQKTLSAGENVSIKNLSPLERQLLLRGSNAALLAGSSLATDPSQSLQDFAANLVVGLTFPVGRAPKEEISTILPARVSETKREPLQLGPARINFPTEEFSPVYTQTRENPTNYLPSGEVGQNKYGERFAADVETGFKMQAEPQNVRLALDTAALNLLDLRKSLETQSYKVEGDSLETVLFKQQAIQNAVNYLEKAIPKDALEFFEQNETPIREALRGNQEARKQKEDFISRNAESLTPDDASPIRIKEPVYKDGKLREDIGRNNILGTNRQGAERIMKGFFDITSKQGTLQSSILPYGDIIARKISDLGYLSAFFIEDYYHRGIEPKIDVIANRLRDALGDASKYLTDDHIKEAFSKGINYFNSNIADPFFSKLKQDALEKLPKQMTAEQARNVLSVHKQEFEWMAGLEDFLTESEGKKISRDKLVEIIQKGQVRVDESVAQELQAIPEYNKLNKESYELVKRRNAIYGTMRDEGRAYETPEERTELNTLLTQINAKNERISKVIKDAGVLKYSLKSYSAEKLELPGAQNSKEVKLISVFEESIDKGNIGDFQTPLRYQSPHWNESNVVAHYRANDRVYTDNKRIYFGEEFQSDWNHDIREKGVRIKGLTAENYEQKGFEIQKVRSKYDDSLVWIFGKRGELTQEKFLDTVPVGVDVRSGLNFNYPKTIEEAAEVFVTHTNSETGLVEPNPFMQHNWKELVLKRFLRDAAIAKDENGNYKYDAIGWTTARQQLERYGGLLEGKDLRWTKNSDGTYSFDFRRSTPEFQTIPPNQHWEKPHELQNISLERLEELTTKEAADFVREQETKLRKDHIEDPNYIDRFGANGQFSLSETVELRSREGTYADYDIAYKNILSKIGKRFGAKYSEREIETGLFGDKGEEYFDTPGQREITGLKPRVEKIHSLEITPSMRQSLEKEGLPLYGTGGSEKLNSPETGIRNRITTREAFDQHRNELVKALEDFIEPIDYRIESVKEIETRINESKTIDDLEAMRVELEARKNRLNNTFNSGLNPDALIDQFKLLYAGVKDFQEFSSRVIKRFGEEVRPFLHDLWIQVQGIQDVVSSSFDDISDYLQNGKNSPIFKSRQFKEGGFLGIGTKASQALKDYENSKQREGIFRVIPPKLWRGIGLAQASVDFGRIYNVMRSGQRARNAFESGVLDRLKSANDYTKKVDPHTVAEIVFQGNEQQKVFGAAELSTKGLDSDQIEAYREIRKAEDLNLEWRKQHTLYNMRERADQLNNRLLTKTPGTPEHDAILGQLLDLSKVMTDVEAHYEHLKNSGYISLQRQGNIVALANDASGLLYQHFDSTKEANKWALDQEAAGASGSKIYDFRLPEDLRAASARLTPGQFEDLVDQSGVNPNTKEVEQLRDEVYSRYPSHSYQLKRDFTRGYDRNWKFVLDSIAHQTEVYANSFYARVAGNEGLKKLSQLDLYNKNPEMYEIAKKFIDDEISSPDRSTGAAIGGGIRKGVYLLNLGFDINQLYLNAVAQPITQTYSYFARVEHNGIKLGRAAAEKYFIEAGGLINKLAANRLAEKLGSSVKLDVDPLFESIYSRLQAEKVIEPEFNKSLLEIESQKSVQNQLAKKIDIFNWQKFEHWASVFMRAGEKTTRAHAAAEAFLVGTKKFNLAGEELVDFMVRAVDATQSNPSRGEAPFYVRKFGEAGKLFYQFNAFNHMWVENLALNVRSDFQGRSIKATAKHLAPLVIMGGIKGLPLTGFAFGLYTLITGDDIKKKYFDQWFKNHDNLERLALYGVTTSPAISQKVSPNLIVGHPASLLAAPILSGNLMIGDSIKDTVLSTLASSTIPALSTTSQILQGFDDLLSKDQKLRGLGEISPRFARGPLTVARTSGAVLDEEIVKGEGYRTRGGSVIVHKKKLTSLDKAGQFFNITPIEVSEYYEKKKSEKLEEIHKKIMKRLRRL